MIHSTKLRLLLLVVLLVVITQSFSPTTPSFLLSAPQVPQPSFPPALSRNVHISPSYSVWRLMILCTSKSLTYSSDGTSTELPKFDSTFAEAIGRSLKKWKNSQQTKSATSPPSNPSPSTVSSSNQIKTEEKGVIDSKSQPITAPATTNAEEMTTDPSKEEAAQQFTLHPEIAKYRQEELQKQWKSLQRKVQDRVSSRNYLTNLMLSKEIKAFEQQVLTKDVITEKELLSLAEKEERYFGSKSRDTPIKELLTLFPEIKAIVPKFARRRNGSLITCQADEDCPQPLTCCPGFLSNGERFCCSGWGERVLVPSYQYLTLKNELPPTSEEERWRDGHRSPYQCPN